MVSTSPSSRFGIEGIAGEEEAGGLFGKPVGDAVYGRVLETETKIFARTQDRNGLPDDLLKVESPIGRVRGIAKTAAASRSLIKFCGTPWDLAKYFAASVASIIRMASGPKLVMF